MSWGAVIVAGGAIVSSVIGSKSSKKAAGAAGSAQDRALAEQQRQFDIAQENQRPFLDAAYGALDRQNQAMNGDFSSFYNAPDYQFALDQGIKTVNRGQVGNLFGGGTSADLMRFGQGLATQNYNNWWNRNAGLAGQGQVSAQNLAGLGSNYANMYSNTMGNIGDIRSSAIQNQGNLWGNAIGQIAGAAGQYFGNRNQQSSQAPTWNYGGNLFGQQASTGQGSIYNFGNNVGNFRGWSA